MNQFVQSVKTSTQLVCVLMMAAVAACSGGGQKQILGAPAIGTPPTVTATSPVATTPPTVAVVSQVTATFSQMMTASTLTPTSFTLACPAGTPITATVAYNTATQTATLTPSAALPSNTLCVATVTTAAQNTSGLGLASNFVWSFTTATPPTVVLTIPAAGATNVPRNTRVSATFNVDMNPTTLSATSFTLMNAATGAPVAGTVSYSAASKTAVFTPTAPAVLPVSTLFTATITTGATDVAGNGLPASYVWTFTTGLLTDTVRPTVIATVPAASAAGVPTNTKITATFSKDMDATTLTPANFTVTNTTLGTPVAGTVVYSAAARTATFTPTTPPLASNTLFTATINMAATDLEGNGLAGTTAALPNASNYVWTFTTGAAANTTPPTVTLVNPANGATGVCLTKTVAATFSTAMDPTTINSTTFTVTAAGVAVPGSVTYSTANNQATFTPTNAAGFAPSTMFTATVKSGNAGVKDLSGNAMTADMVWSFTTGTQACLAVINLRSAATFGAFGGAAGVTNQGIKTVVNGNLGTTGACTLVTGFHDSNNVYTETTLNIGTVNGTIDCAPPAPGTAQTLQIAQQALADAQTAYNQMAGLPPNPGSAQLAGLTLPPAVYTAPGGTFAITGSNLTLDAQGDPNAEWVFQSASSLTVGQPATPVQVILINGAQAKNVFWQVGSAARIEIGSQMVGTIIASSGVTISTAGTNIQTALTGRALGLNASVTMVNTTIVAP
ncbi:MAG: Ig-like domain-containing protein [Pseudomonadota bacterium]|nr:Ig-like domain-containing protein [Pseudomonadota bacterium]